MKFSWKTEALSLAMIAAMFILAAVMWSSAPDRIPVHWGISGEVDRYGGKFEGLLSFPIAGLVLYLILLLVPRIDPRRAHYAAFEGAYHALRTVAVGVVLVLDFIVLLIVNGRAINMNQVVPIVVGAALLIVGNYLPRLTSNWFMGVRTPWTLSSEESWRRTHLLAGRLFMASGVITIVAAWLAPSLVFWVIMGTILPSALVSVVYSYFAWRNDPDRRNGSA